MEINKKHFIQVFLTCLILVVICEFIGQRTIAIGKASIVLFPMLYAVIIGLIITPDLLGKKIKALKKVIGEKEINIAGEVVGIALVMLGIKYGTTVGPNIDKIIQAGPAFIAQEFGHILAPIVALPLALMFGMNSPEGSGVLGTYLMGTVLGTIYFSVLGSISIYSGLHPYALGMACGVGSGSMMTAAAGSLSTMVPPEMADTILAYAATSNMMSSITGIIFLVFVSLPFTNFMYKILEPKFSRNKKTKEIKSKEKFISIIGYVCYWSYNSYRTKN